ncbi:transmembrane protein [Ceratobasidium theobromae]|uniref:Transmembrane protein n=1 Tax=Ceratobasidium theobromae TaxID=1582974 RepID=A0A5N5QNZ9_9AGAM|nr:transmembrane protein [Ceratobasidium theobromae]
MPSFAIASLAAAALFASQVAAQAWSNATCVDQLWSINSRQQSPCLVSAYLSAQCTTDNYWGVPEIGTEGPYSPPSGTYANLCRCNSVQWNLLSACSMCQGGPSGTWQEWITNCTQAVTTVGDYPLPVPAGVSIPHWAYYDFTATGVFNAVIASQQSGPESSAVASATSATAVNTRQAGGGSATAVASPSTTLYPTGSSSKSSGSSNIGAIVGGAVGGVLGLALIGVIAFFLVRKGKQTKDTTPASQYPQSNYDPSMYQPSLAAPMMGQYQPGVQHPGMMSPPPVSEYKSYDPSGTPSMYSTNGTAPPAHYAESIPYSHPQHPQPRPGQYNGAPEV